MDSTDYAKAVGTETYKLLNNKMYDPTKNADPTKGEWTDDSILPGRVIHTMRGHEPSSSKKLQLI